MTSHSGAGRRSPGRVRRAADFGFGEGTDLFLSAKRPEPCVSLAMSMIDQRAGGETPDHVKRDEGSAEIGPAMQPEAFQPRCFHDELDAEQEDQGATTVPMRREPRMDRK
jgi:hypothetical protein